MQVVRHIATCFAGMKFGGCILKRGVAAYDSEMNVYGYSTTTFTTLDLSSITDDALGDPSDAGSLTENELE